MEKRINKCLNRRWSHNCHLLSSPGSYAPAYPIRHRHHHQNQPCNSAHILALPLWRLPDGLSSQGPLSLPPLGYCCDRSAEVKHIIIGTLCHLLPEYPLELRGIEQVRLLFPRPSGHHLEPAAFGDFFLKRWSKWREEVGNSSVLFRSCLVSLHVSKHRNCFI